MVLSYRFPGNKIDKKKTTRLTGLIILTLGLSVKTALAPEFPNLNNQSNKSYCFSISLYSNTINGWGLSNEVCRELLPKKSKVMLYLLFITR